MARYALDERYVLKNASAIEQGNPVVVQVRDNELLTWRNVRAILSPNLQEGAEKVELFDLHGVPKGEWYIKVLEEVEEAAVHVEEDLKGF